MLTFDTSDLIMPARGGGQSHRGFRYNLTKEKNGHYLTLEMPNRQLPDAIGVNPEDPETRVQFFRLSADAVRRADMEPGQYIVVQSSSGGNLLKKRGAASSSIRIGTFDITDEKAGEARKQFNTDITYSEANINGNKAAVFRLPDWAE